jgi:hypothetical protein
MPVTITLVGAARLAIIPRKPGAGLYIAVCAVGAPAMGAAAARRHFTVQVASPWRSSCQVAGPCLALALAICWWTSVS